MSELNLTRWQRFSDAHSNFEEPNIRWESRFKPGAPPNWELATASTYTQWMFGIEVSREYGGSYQASRWWIALGFGPWSMALTRTWYQEAGR